MVGQFCSEVIEVERFSDLIPPFSMDWHGFDLNEVRVTLRVMVAPDSRSPNL
jgi:hypothetical protein